MYLYMYIHIIEYICMICTYIHTYILVNVRTLYYLIIQ